jgi:glyoxylase-like metal-dependent hydrolase (beta-lactamase superfamily II)
MERWRILKQTDRRRTRFGEEPRYAEGLYDLGGGVYSWMLPNGCWYESNAGLVVGEGEALLVDTQSDLNYTGEMLEVMASVTGGAPIRYLVNTHSDGDHIWGNQLLEGAEIIMTRAGDEEARELKPVAMALLGMAGKALRTLGVGGIKRVGDYFHKMVSAYDFRPVKVRAATRTFEGELSLEVGGREVRLMEVGPAHTRGDLMVYVPDARVLFAGDVLFSGSTPVLWAGPVENCMAALDRILDMEVEVIVPGHGPLCGKEAVSRAREYLEYLGSEAARRFNAGMSAKEAAYDIVLGEDFSGREWSRWDLPERIIINTHVIYRHMQRRTGHMKAAEKLNVLRKQAQLAYKLPDARPASLHRLGEEA